jgi:hypothetical protein
MKPTQNELLTVAEFRRHLEGIPDDASISFGCNSLIFYRVKQRGNNCYQIEFNQSVYDNEKGEVFIENHFLPEQRQ